MTKNITPLTYSNNFFNDLFVLANTLTQVLANEIVTANSAPGGGAMSAGNGFVVGIFGANTLVATTIAGGNVTNSGTLWTGSNVAVNANYSLISGVTTINSTAVSIGNTFVNSTILEVGSNVVVNTSAIEV